MNFKSIAFAAALVAASVPAMAATVITPAASPVLANTYAASFSGYGTTNEFTLDLSSFTGINLVNALVTANFSGGVGYDVSNVKFDGINFTPVVDVSLPQYGLGADLWSLNLTSLTSGPHTITVEGLAKGGSTAGFTGSLSFVAQPVPEPETYGMMLAGLALVGVVAARRKNAA